MQIIKYKAEEILKGTLKDLRQLSVPYRCMAFYASKIEDLGESWFDVLCAKVKETFGETDIKIFLCEDKDVFVLKRDVTQKKFNVLVDVLKDQNLCFEKDKSDLFEIGFENKLSDIIRSKIVRFMKDKYLKKQKDKVPQIELREADLKADDSLVDTINARRSNRDKTHILIIEDDLFTQKIVSKSIKEEAEVFTSDTAEKGLRLYAKHAPDILFLDIGLPDSNGHEVLEKIQAMDTNSFVVMLSGNGNKDNVMKAIENGAKGFIGKPFTADKINHYIKASLNQSQKNLKKEVL